MRGENAADRSTDSETTDRPERVDDDVLLAVRDLSTRFSTREGQVNAVTGLDLDVGVGDSVGIVGESGSGKSVFALSLMGLIADSGRITDGEIWYRNPRLASSVADTRPEAVSGDLVDLLRVSATTRRTLRGPSFSMIFQDPMSSFNPTLTVGEQVAEAVEVQRRARADPRSVKATTNGYGLGSMILGTVLPSKRFVSERSYDRAVELLEQVGIPDPERRADEYPHQFSGGMLQRAMIAQALAGEPDLLIADEPTTALDVTIQAQILHLLGELQAEREMSVLLITHNLGVVAKVCDRVGVMYAGEIVERGRLEDVFDDPVHPYTEGLLNSVPDVDSRERLQPIPGNVPSLLDHEMEDRCYFAERCPRAMEKCLEKPDEYGLTDEHAARCYLAISDYDESSALPPERLGREEPEP